MPPYFLVSQRLFSEWLAVFLIELGQPARFDDVMEQISLGHISAASLDGEEYGRDFVEGPAQRMRPGCEASFQEPENHFGH